MRARTLLVVAAAFLVAAIGWTEWPRGEPAFPGYRQASRQEVPGTFGLTIAPPPSGFDPAVSPGRAEAIAAQGQAAPGPVSVTLASVPGFYARSQVDVPMWLVIVRNLCYPSAKGELVSSARRPEGSVDRCTDHNLWIQLVDPTTGVRTAVESGYDSSGSWAPAVPGTSVAPGSPGV